MIDRFLLRKSVVFCYVASILIVVQGVTNAQEERTWKDSTGKFSVNAKLVEFDGENVKLAKSDGRVVTLSLDKLSFSDQIYLKSLPKESDNPFAGGEPTNKSRTTPSPVVGTTTQTGAARQGNVSGAEKIIPGIVSGWNYKPEPMTLDDDNVNYKPCPLVVENGFPNFESLDIVKGADAAIAVASLDNHEKKHTVVYIMNMTTGKTVTTNMPSMANIWGVSPDGKQIMATSKDFSNNLARSKLDFYAITDKGATHSSTLIPYADGKGDYDRIVEWAAWVTPAHVLTCGYGHTIRLWDMKSGKAVYTMTMDSNKVILSKDCKAMVVATKSGVVVCDTMTGKTLGIVSSEVPFMMEFDFSPDNTRLLGVMRKAPERMLGRRLDDFSDQAPSPIIFWDMITGEKTGEITLDPDYQPPKWVDNRMIIRGSIMYDSLSGVPVCHYDGGISLHRAVSFNGLYCYFVYAGQKDCLLGSAKLPHQAALDAVEKIEPKDRFALYPGVEVSVKIETDGSADEKEIRNRLEENLKRNGFVVKDSAKVQFLASVKKNAEGDVTYSGEQCGIFPPPPFLRGRGPSVDVKVTIYESVLTISNNGKPFWKLGVLTVPESIELDKDRSIQEAADELCKPDMDFFVKTSIPRYHSGQLAERVPFTITRPGGMSNESALINAKLGPTDVR